MTNTLASILSSKKALGNQGEAIALSYFQQHGYRVLHTNWRAGRMGEIDLIVECPSSKPDEGLLVFVEVKTRRGKQKGHPLEAIDARKQQQMFKVAEAFLAQYPNFNATHRMRFDAVGIEWDGRSPLPVIHHLENII